MRLTIAILALSAALTLPSTAAAQSGSITDVHPSLDGSTVYATYTTNFDRCTDYGYCGWYPHAWEVPASQSCFVDSSYLTYVGDFHETSGSETATDFFYPTFNPTRICLYASHDGDEYFIADYVYTAPGAPPPPAPVPPPAPPKPTSGNPTPEPSRLTLREARSLLRDTLRDKYGRRFAQRRHYSRSCHWWTAKKVRCNVRWEFMKRYRYRGTVTLWLDPDDPESYFYRTSIRRKSLRPRRQSAPSRPAPPAAPSCDPNYGGCLDPDASDYDCAGGSGDGPRYTGPVRVIGDDHFDLDRDGDGVGCDD